jgi:hypothetical protein
LSSSTRTAGDLKRKKEKKEWPDALHIYRPYEYEGVVFPYPAISLRDMVTQDHAHLAGTAVLFLLMATNHGDTT